MYKDGKKIAIGQIIKIGPFFAEKFELEYVLIMKRNNLNLMCL